MSKKITHSMTHYLLTIHKLNEENKRSKLIDIAKELKNARSSVSVAVKKLSNHELINSDKNNNLILTKKAHDIVHDVLSNRTLIYYFFKNFLGVSTKNSKSDSCMIENLISTETQKKLFSFMKLVLESNNTSKSIKADLKISKYKSLKEFKNKQVGDTHLP